MAEKKKASEILGSCAKALFLDGTVVEVYPATLEDLEPALEAWSTWVEAGATIQAAYAKTEANKEGKIKEAFESLLFVMLGKKIEKSEIRKNLRVDNEGLAKALDCFLGFKRLQADEGAES